MVLTFSFIKSLFCFVLTRAIMIPCMLYAHLSGDSIISEQKDVHLGEQETRAGRTLRTEPACLHLCVPSTQQCLARR